MNKILVLNNSYGVDMPLKKLISNGTKFFSFVCCFSLLKEHKLKDVSLGWPFVRKVDFFDIWQVIRAILLLQVYPHD